MGESWDEVVNELETRSGRGVREKAAAANRDGFHMGALERGPTLASYLTSLSVSVTRSSEIGVSTSVSW